MFRVPEPPEIVASEQKTIDHAVITRELAHSLAVTAFVQRDLGDIDSALQSATIARDLIVEEVQLSGISNPEQELLDILSLRSMVGSALLRVGLERDAINLLEQTVALGAGKLSEASPAASLILAESQNALGLAHERLGNHENAIASFDDGLELISRSIVSGSVSDASEAQVLQVALTNNRGVALTEVSETGARAAFEQAQSIARNLSLPHVEEAISLNTGVSLANSGSSDGLALIQETAERLSRLAKQDATVHEQLLVAQINVRAANSPSDIDRTIIRDPLLNGIVINNCVAHSVAIGDIIAASALINEFANADTLEVSVTEPVLRNIANLSRRIGEVARAAEFDEALEQFVSTIPRGRLKRLPLFHNFLSSDDTLVGQVRVRRGKKDQRLRLIVPITVEEEINAEVTATTFVPPPYIYRTGLFKANIQTRANSDVTGVIELTDGGRVTIKLFANKSEHATTGYYVLVHELDR